MRNSAGFRAVLSALAAAWVVFAGAAAAAQEDSADGEGAQVSAEETLEARPGKTDWGLNVDVQVASHYVFRGLNVFKDDDQRDPNMLLAPGLSWTIMDSGVTLGYWSAYQITGNDISGNVDRGLGAEQDLYVTWEDTFKEHLHLALWFFYYFYPAADEETAGVSNPSYLEPCVSLGITSGIDVNIDFAYFLGVQDAIRSTSYLYIHPHIGKSIEINEVVALELAFGYGFKVWKDDSNEDNTHDVHLSVALPIQFSYGFYLKPVFAVAWTNIEPVPVDPDEHRHLPSGSMETLHEQPHETIVWGGVNVGVNL